MSELEALLRKSLEERRAKPSQAVEDLKAIVVEMSTAIRNVTGGRFSLVLDPLKPKPQEGPTYAVLLKLGDEDSVIRVVAFSEQGYPAKVISSYPSWDAQTGSAHWVHCQGSVTLRAALQSLMSGPDSELVRIIDNQLAVMKDESGALAGSASG